MDGYQAHLDDAFALENFRKPPKTVGDLVHFWISSDIINITWKLFNYLKTTLWSFKSWKQFTRNKSTQGKEQTTRTFAIRFPCTNKIYKRSPKCSNEN